MGKAALKGFGEPLLVRVTHSPDDVGEGNQEAGGDYEEHLEGGPSGVRGYGGGGEVGLEAVW